jgi:hypothetical protein
MNNKDLEELVNCGRSVYESALIVFVCSLGAGIAILLAILLSAIK